MQYRPQAQSDPGLQCLHMRFCQKLECAKILGHLPLKINSRTPVTTAADDSIYSPQNKA